MKLELNRVMVVGPCGSGKSTFARRLGAMLGVPVVHMDALAWSAGWTMTPKDIYAQRIRSATAGPRWILDGNTRSAEIYHAADAVIFLDVGRATCFWRVLRRVIMNHGRVRADMAGGCPERLDLEFLEYVWNYRDDYRPTLLSRLRKHANNKEVITLHDASEVEQFFREVRRTCA